MLKSKTAPQPRALILEPREHLHIDDRARLAVRNAQRNVAGLLGLLAENRDNQSLFGGQLALALRRNLADEDIVRPHFGADANDAVAVQVLQDVLADVRNVARDLFRPELGIPGLGLVFLDVDGGEHVVLHHSLRKQDGVFVVVAVPRHERDEDVLAQRQLALVGARPVRNHIALAAPACRV